MGVNLKTYFAERYDDEQMREIYIEEYLPWTKSGVLKDGKLRDLYNKIEDEYPATALIAVEAALLQEYARRFANVGPKTIETKPPTHEVIDLVYHEDEGNIPFQGTEQECNDFVTEQGCATFTYEVKPIIKK